MSASAPITCTANTWVLVSAGTTSATIHKLSTAPNVYKQTFVDSGDAAPTNDDNAILAFAPCDSFTFSNPTAADIYIKAVGVDGEVRADD